MDTSKGSPVAAKLGMCWMVAHITLCQESLLVPGPELSAVLLNTSEHWPVGESPSFEGVLFYLLAIQHAAACLISAVMLNSPSACTASAPPAQHLGRCAPRSAGLHAAQTSCPRQPALVHSMATTKTGTRTACQCRTSAAAEAFCRPFATAFLSWWVHEWKLNTVLWYEVNDQESSAQES